VQLIHADSKGLAGTDVWYSALTLLVRSSVKYHRLMEAKQTQRQLRMEDELWDRAKRVAEDLDRSVSWVIRDALSKYIDQHLGEKRAAKAASKK
jgi:predicted DNA-binding protein